MYKLFPKKPIAIAGFTITEMLIAIAIISLVTMTVMVRHSSFNSSMMIENQAYEISFDIRQTQTRAISPQVSVSGSIRDGYGIRFVNDNTYEIFRADSESLNDKITINQMTLDSRFEMSFSDESGILPNNSYIFFQRPDFDAYFYDDSNNLISGDEFIINVRATNDPSSVGINITVTPTGQISVSRP